MMHGILFTQLALGLTVCSQPRRPNPRRFIGEILITRSAPQVTCCHQLYSLTAASWQYAPDSHARNISISWTPYAEGAVRHIVRTINPIGCPEKILK